MADNNENTRNYQGTGFTQQQWTALQSLMRAPGPPGPPGQQGPQGLPGEPGATGITATGSDRWNPADLGYFDPHLDKSYGEGEIVTVGKDLYFRSVILFVERIKDLATVKGDALVRTNLNTSLRGAALKWYTAELSNLERTGLRNDPRGVEEWCNALLVRFKELPGVALSHLTSEKYTATDARAKREPADYVQAIIRHAKSANIETVLNQLTFAHQGLSPELRVFIDPPTATTTVASFIQALEMKKDAWFDLNSKSHASGQRLPSQLPQRPAFRSYSQQPSGYQNQGQQAYGQQQQYGRQPYSQQPFPSRPYSSNDQNAYRSQQYQYGNPRYEARPQQQQLPSTRRPPLQITGPPSGSGSSTSSSRPPQAGQGQAQGQGSRRFGSQGYGNRQPWQQNYRPKAAAYQASTSASDEENNQQQDDSAGQQDYDEHHEAYQAGEDTYQDEQGQAEFEQENQPEESFAGFIGIGASCRNCNASFRSKSKLHKHLRQDCLTREQKPSAISSPLPSSCQVDAFSVEIIDSEATDRNNVGTGLAFRGWNYAHLLIRLLLEAIDEEICADTGCGVTLADKAWLLALLPHVEIRKMASPLRVKGLGSAMHDTNEYVLIPMYIPATKGDKRVLCRIYREVHLVDNLKAHMLLGNDIIGPEKIVLDIAQGKAYIGSCGATAAITSKQRGPYQRRIIHARKALAIAPRADALVPIITPQGLPDRDFIFEPTQQRDLTMYAHLIDSHVAEVLVKNETDHVVQVPKKLRLGMLCEIDYENVFFAEPTSQLQQGPCLQKGSAAKPPANYQTGWIKKAATLASVASMTLAGSLSALVHHAIADPVDIARETKLPNGVTVYGNKQDTKVLTSLVNEFPTLWEDEGFAKIPEEDWMKLTLRDDWQARLPKSNRAKIYPLGLEDRAVVDQTFDALQRQGRLKYTTQATPFSYPVFVVWKSLADGTRKGRAVVDIRGLNDLIVPDVYPVPLQSDVIARLLGCTHLSILDAMSFFYQWLVHYDYRHMLTVVSHRGQETFNVPIMGCMNSIAYVQRQIDKILRPIKEFAQAYIDDIVCGSKSLPEHVSHLRRLFKLLVDYNIAIAPTKTFLGYPNINLLGRRVDSFGMATAEDKLKAISQIAYPRTLGDLEHYLGLTGYLRSSVHYYAQLASPLQALKTRLLKEAPTKGGNQRRAYSSKLTLPKASKQEEESFRSLQEALSRPSLLVHHDPERILWMDLDASREWGFGVQVFHVKKDLVIPEGSGKWPPRNTIEPIMFLSRMLTAAEKNYWPTELEIAGFVWAIKKIRHLVESSKHPVIIQTDHSAILDIMKQSSITSTTSTMRMNVRLVRASQFLRQFRLEVRHKPGKEHIVPDALSRLTSARPTSTLSSDHSELDALYTDYDYTSTQVQMSEAFRTRLIEAYCKDKRWAKIIEILKEQAAAERKFKEDAVTNLPFVRKEGLIFHVDKFSGLERLCIPQPLIKQIFDIAHGEGHPGFERCYEIVTRSWYIHGLTKQLRTYIRHCPQCLVLQTRRHRPYGSLQPIQSPPIPFHTLTLDFIMALPLSAEGFDSTMTVTDKFLKRATYIPGAATWKAADWAIALLDRLAIADWGLPRVMLTDRDPKFLSELWEAMFKRLGVDLLYSTAYHPQTDGSSERTNQTAEIALRFYIHTLERPEEWPKVLPRLQALLNNLPSSTTNKTPNELAYGFKLNRPLDLVATIPELPGQSGLARIEAADAISFAQMHQKFHYDRHHQPMYLKTDDEAYLRLHKGYSIPTANAKFGQQYVGPFKILGRVGKQAYRLDIPPHWRVHPVFSLAQLEPCPAGPDPFKRPVPDHPESVFVEGDTQEAKSYEVERLLNKRVRRRGKGESVEYLVRWRGYGPEFDTWYNIKDLDRSMDLIREYEEEMTLRQAPKDIAATKPLLEASKATIPTMPKALAESARIESQAATPPTPKPPTEHAIAVIPPPPTPTISVPSTRLAIEPPP